MLVWLAANWINILLCAAVILLVGGILRSMIRDRKAGKSSCGGNCGSCGGCTKGSCGCSLPPQTK